MPERLERADAADAQHDLLADAHLVVAAVEPAGDLAVVRRGSRGMLVSSR